LRNHEWLEALPTLVAFRTLRPAEDETRTQDASAPLVGRRRKIRTRALKSAELPALSVARTLTWTMRGVFVALGKLRRDTQTCVELDTRHADEAPAEGETLLQDLTASFTPALPPQLSDQDASRSEGLKHASLALYPEDDCGYKHRDAVLAVGFCESVTLIVHSELGADSTPLG
jgi:hypothetical protein